MSLIIFGPSRNFSHIIGRNLAAAEAKKSATVANALPEAFVVARRRGKMGKTPSNTMIFGAWVHQLLLVNQCRVAKVSQSFLCKFGLIMLPG